MTRNKDDKESMPKEHDSQNNGQSPNRWGRFKEFLLARPKGKTVHHSEHRDSNASELSGTSKASKFSDYGFLRKRRTALQGNRHHNKDGARSASKSSGRMKKTKTFSGMFSRGKERLTDEEEEEKYEEDLATMQPYDCKGSFTGIREVPKGANEDSISKSDKLRSIKESDANRTMIFRSDISPCSPSSNKGCTFVEADDSIGSIKRDSLSPDESPLESERLKQSTSNRDTFGQKGQNQNNAAPSNGTHRTPTRTTVSETPELQKVLNMRLGSTAVDDGVAFESFPPNTRRRSSGSPRYIVHSLARSRSAPEETINKRKSAVRNDYESPWGVKDMGDNDKVITHGEDRQLSKGLRVSALIGGFKGRKSRRSLSGLNHGDGKTCKEHRIPQPMDNMQDELVNYSVKQHKNKWNKDNGFKTRRERHSAAPMY